MYVTNDKVLQNLNIRLSVLNSFEALSVETSRSSSTTITFDDVAGDCQDLDQLKRILSLVSKKKIINVKDFSESSYNPWHTEFTIGINMNLLRKYIKETQTQIDKRIAKNAPKITIKPAESSKPKQISKPPFEQRHPNIHKVFIGVVISLLSFTILAALTPTRNYFINHIWHH